MSHVNGLLPISNVFECNKSNVADISSIESIRLSDTFVMQVPTTTSPEGDITPTTNDDCVIQSYQYKKSNVISEKFNPILTNSKLRTKASHVALEISQNPRLFTSLVNVEFSSARLLKYREITEYPILFNGTPYDWNFVWQELKGDNDTDPALITYFDMFFYLDGFQFKLDDLREDPMIDKYKTYKENPQPCYMERQLEYVVDETSNPRYGRWKEADRNSKNDLIDLKLTFRLDNVNVVVIYHDALSYQQTQLKELFSYILDIINEISQDFTREYKGKARVAACQRRVDDMMRKHKEKEKQSLELSLLNQFQYPEIAKVSLIEDMLQKKATAERSASNKQSLGYYAFPLL